MVEEKEVPYMDQETTDRQFRFLDWTDIDELCLSLYCQMHKDNYVPDAIIGLLRGGVVPARIMADYFGIVLDFFALDVKLYTGIGTRREEPVIRYGFKNKDIDKKKVLIIDDIWDSGKTMKAVLDHFKGKEITTATLLWKEGALEKPNYYAEIASENTWYIYPWEQIEFKKEMPEKMKK